MSIFYNSLNQTFTGLGLALIIFGVILLVVILQYVFYLRPLFREIKKNRAAFYDLVSPLGFTPKILYRKEYFIATYKGNPIIGSWSILAKGLLKKTKQIIFHTVVPNTQNIKIRAVTNEQISHISEFSKETIQFLTDKKYFPNEISIVSGHLHFFYGDKAIEDWFQGSGDMANSLMLQIIIPLETPKTELPKKLDALIQAVALIQQDLHLKQ